jgi:hypothetical protein
MLPLCSQTEGFAPCLPGEGGHGARPSSFQVVTWQAFFCGKPRPWIVWRTGAHEIGLHLS